jgi:hypothetical protein
VGAQQSAVMGLAVEQKLVATALKIAVSVFAATTFATEQKIL